MLAKIPATDLLLIAFLLVFLKKSKAGIRNAK